MAYTQSQKQTLGRGKLYFAILNDDGSYAGERYIGNTPAFGLTISADRLEHFDSDEGVKEKDLEITLQTNRSGSFTTDQVDPRNLAMLFFGAYSLLSVTSATGLTETFESVEQGLFYQLGVDLTHPSGRMDVDNVVVEVGASTMTVGTDYTIDEVTGRLGIVVGGGIADGDDVDVTYDQTAHTRDQILTGSEEIKGSLRFIADNPQGPDHNYFIRYCRLSPNGEMQLKGDNWQELPFTVSIQKATGYPAITIDGRPL